MLFHCVWEYNQALTSMDPTRHDLSHRFQVDKPNTAAAAATSSVLVVVAQHYAPGGNGAVVVGFCFVLFSLVAVAVVGS